MAIIELAESRDITVSEEAPMVELLFIVAGTEDEVTARLQVEQSLPAFYTIVRSLRSITTVFQSYQCRHRGGGVWDVNARYGKRSPPALDKVTINFDTGGGTTHITQSLQTVRSFYRDPALPATAEDVDAPDLQKAINVDKDRVGGVDIGVATYKWSETWHIAREFLTSDYRYTLKNLTKTVNDAKFREFEAGEVLFNGVTGVKDTDESISEMTFHFEQSDNAFDLIVGPFGNITKLGWEYLWVQYTDDVKMGSAVKKPKAVYVEQVYHESDFAFLGIGTRPLD